MPKTLTELHEARGRLVTKAREALDEIKSNTDEARAAELEARHDKIMGEFDALEKSIEREERQAEIERQAEERAQRAREAQRPNPGATEARGGENDGAPEYRDVFAKAIRFGMSSLTSEERDVMVANRGDLTPEQRAQATGTDAAGGYLVPTEIVPEIERSMAAWGPMWDAAIVREITTGSGNPLTWPTVNDTANTGRIKAENAAVDDDGTDDVVFGQKTLDAYVYDTGMVRVPMELLQDAAFDISGLIDDLFGERLGRLANAVLTTGTGFSQPNGIVTASTLGKTAASATAITSDEVIDLLHSIDPAYRGSPKCRFQFNDSTLAALKKLKDGQGNYLWMMGDVRAGEPDRLLGHSYSVNQAMAPIATGNRSIIFGDHSRYVVRKVVGFQVVMLRERYAEAFQIGMVGFKRFDGELINTAAVKHLVQA